MSYGKSAALAAALCIVLPALAAMAADRTTMPAPPAAAKAPAKAEPSPLPPPPVALAPLDQVLAGLEKHYAQVSSMEATFTQEYRSRTTRQVKNGSGSLVFEKPKKMRWSYDTAPKKLFVYDGQFFIMAEYEDKVASRTKVVMQQDLVTALVFLTGKGHVTDHFETRVVAPSQYEPDIPVGDRIILEMLPKDDTETFAVMYLLLQPGSYAVSEVILYDLVGNRNRIAFDKTRYNQKVDPSQFTFIPPRDWKVEEY